MKKSMVKTTLAAALLVSGILGQGSARVAEAEAAAGTPATTTTKAQPIMTDNLAKYGLKKDVELPVTVTAGGLSYTLEKIMIYDAKSKDAQTLAKKYGYDFGDSKYFLWTKITVENKANTLIQRNVRDLNEKWRLSFGDRSKGEAFNIMPRKQVYKENSKDALWTWVLKPGEKLSTYQAFLYTGDFNYFVVWLDNKNMSATKYIVDDKK